MGGEMRTIILWSGYLAWSVF